MTSIRELETIVGSGTMVAAEIERAVESWLMGVRGYWNLPKDGNHNKAEHFVQAAEMLRKAGLESKARSYYEGAVESILWCRLPPCNDLAYEWLTRKLGRSPSEAHQRIFCSNTRYE